MNLKRKDMIGSNDSFISNLQKKHYNADLRSKGREGLESLSAPTRRSERWKYSPISKLLTKSLKSCAGENVVWPEAIMPNPVPHLNAYLMVFRNGFFVSSLSDLPYADGVICTSASQSEYEAIDGTYHEKEWVGAMNAAYHQDGAYIKIDKGVVLDRPIIIHHLTNGEDIASLPRHSVILGDGAEADIILWNSATEDSSGMCNGIFEAHVGKNASLRLEKVCNEHGDIYNFSHESIRQERDSRFVTNNFTVRGSWVRNELCIKSQGEGTDSVFNGAYMPADSDHVDNHTTMDHAFPNCTSSEMYKGIMYDKSTGVFNGKIYVRLDAQKTAAFQQNSNIVASKGATINTKPELEIYADDVKCSHGCTVGQFDEEAMFYLNARGIDEESAKSLLVQAYIGDVLNSVKYEEIKNEVVRLYSERHGWL